jgi:hypothetical protein
MIKRTAKDVIACVIWAGMIAGFIFWVYRPQSGGASEQGGES